MAEQELKPGPLLSCSFPGHVDIWTWCLCGCLVTVHWLFWIRSCAMCFQILTNRFRQACFLKVLDFSFIYLLLFSFKKNGVSCLNIAFTQPQEVKQILAEHIWLKWEQEPKPPSTISPSPTEPLVLEVYPGSWDSVVVCEALEQLVSHELI